MVTLLKYMRNERKATTYCMEKSPVASAILNPINTILPVRHINILLMLVIHILYIFSSRSQWFIKLHDVSEHLKNVMRFQKFSKTAHNQRLFFFQTNCCLLLSNENVTLYIL